MDDSTLPSNQLVDGWLVKKLDSNYDVINKMINHETSAIHFATIDKLLNLFDCSIDELFIVEKDHHPV